MYTVKIVGKVDSEQEITLDETIKGLWGPEVGLQRLLQGHKGSLHLAAARLCKGRTLRLVSGLPTDCRTTFPATVYSEPGWDVVKLMTAWHWNSGTLYISPSAKSLHWPTGLTLGERAGKAMPGC